jgi:hypothetical protein
MNKYINYLIVLGSVSLILYKFYDILFTNEEHYNNMNLIYKNAEKRGYIYLGKPELLDSIHGSTYSNIIESS